ncbi:hypothetical protein FOZ60_000392 [Perkinsus olseni]|uniref:Uncharacterized protein n=1 Tax=Perkinsus olseni TaxID=32597 RepID=A0A7J6N089_PEROL|nr:hypothetical protein FOZ60_000392 [Perkinsus olseni]KAF4697800.1 hypothetical protein FOZ62_025774 [Perkinsus olseni]
MLHPSSVWALYCRSLERRWGGRDESDGAKSAKQMVMSFLGVPAVRLDCPREEILIPHYTGHLIVDDKKPYKLAISSYPSQNVCLTELLVPTLETPVSIDMQHCCRSIHYDGKTRRLAIISDDDEGVKLNIYDLRQMILLKTWKVDCIPKYSNEGHFSQKLLVVGDCAFVAFVRENAYGELRFINLDWSVATLKALPAWSYAFSLPESRRPGNKVARNRSFKREFWESRKFLDLFAVPEEQSIDIAYLDDNSYRVTRVSQIRGRPFPSFRSDHLLCRGLGEGSYQCTIRGSNLIIFCNGDASYHVCNYFLKRKGPDWEDYDCRHSHAACAGCDRIYRYLWRAWQPEVAGNASRIAIEWPYRW